MRILLQKVTQAAVSVDGSIIGRIGRGYLFLLCVLQGDTEDHVHWLAEKVAKLRLFDGDDRKVNDRSVLDIGGSILVVSQFTLAADTAKGNRPDYTRAADPAIAEELYNLFVHMMRSLGVPKVETGRFGGHMEVTLTNDGPVTILLER